MNRISSNAPSNSQYNDGSFEQLETERESGRKRNACNNNSGYGYGNKAYGGKAVDCQPVRCALPQPQIIHHASPNNCAQSKVFHHQLPHLSIAGETCNQNIVVPFSVGGHEHHIYAPNLHIASGHQMMVQPQIDATPDYFHVHHGEVQDNRAGMKVAMTDACLNQGAAYSKGKAVDYQPPVGKAAGYPAQGDINKEWPMPLPGDKGGVGQGGIGQGDVGQGSIGKGGVPPIGKGGDKGGTIDPTPAPTPSPTPAPVPDPTVPAPAPVPETPAAGPVAGQPVDEPETVEEPVDAPAAREPAVTPYSSEFARYR